ncbi:MAG: hypothetical protein A2365_00605 [Candidatus Nealsonbacteria bacterium RIFOXYB1_FULL_40_15]|uniref:Methyltransferase domain-containing protein n=2 Tax=Candidatus Nealsoniibacteriota TaxID=1817911 RepID=A0A1G2ETQ8_9BACT|nr:MAG: hypothetical protein A2365_00605 [Candidatus Nealsonbacteria bacterium RIFOXYB1_FULL_40_15]OGZ28771.1 MAG: hypothetical protein A2427_01785 [Candidatus Nealsonbacteria bacterium RIFOXYC1_FULL_40_7]OGZ29049.1 MAG: hypothetical protein A2562_01035 [Candidatus Nealsonbacteria bacterium RIFOXYD1_FULL_39_11]
MENNFDREVSVEDFAESFGTTVEDIGQECREIIKQSDFKYRIIKGKERDDVFLSVLKKLETDRQVIGAPERTDQWEKGWNENLQEFLKSGGEIGKLIPKFIRPNQPIRFMGEYIMPSNSNFEHDYFSVFRCWLFTKYFKDFNDIYEFGAGSGFNLVPLAKMYPEKNIYGSDFVPSSPELINQIAKKFNLKIEGMLFDMRHPDESYKIKPGSAVFTAGTMEQLASDFEPFLQYLFKNPFSLCIHSEPIVEEYDENILFDYLAARFHRKRGYTEGLLPRLKELEKEGKIEILKIKRLFFGSLFMEGFTLIIWQPKKI